MVASPRRFLESSRESEEISDFKNISAGLMKRKEKSISIDCRSNRRKSKSIKRPRVSICPMLLDDYLNPWNFDSAVYGTTEELLEMRFTLSVSDSTEHMNPFIKNMSLIICSLTWTNLNWIREFYKGQSCNSTIDSLLLDWSRLKQFQKNDAGLLNIGTQTINFIVRVSRIRVHLVYLQTCIKEEHWFMNKTTQQYSLTWIRVHLVYLQTCIKEEHWFMNKTTQQYSLTKNVTKQCSKLMGSSVFSVNQSCHREVIEPFETSHNPWHCPQMKDSEKKRNQMNSKRLQEDDNVLSDRS
ncbi:hypothetical protein YC2023_022950 [Brassica napus]